MKINVKRWLWASLAVFVVISVVGFVVHGVLLQDIYKQTASVWRPEAAMNSMAWLIHLGAAIYALMFAFIYTVGFEKNKPNLGQGVRYGFYIWLLACFALAFTWHAVLPIPTTLSVYWAIAGLVESLLAGAIVGLIYKK